MARVTEGRLEHLVKRLNRACGFKGRKYVRVKSTGKLKTKGSGFGISGSYGRKELVFESKGTTGERSISYLMTKKELESYMVGMLEGIDYYKKRSKLK